MQRNSHFPNKSKETSIRPSQKKGAFPRKILKRRSPLQARPKIPLFLRRRNEGGESEQLTGRRAAQRLKKQDEHLGTKKSSGRVQRRSSKPQPWPFVATKTGLQTRRVVNHAKGENLLSTKGLKSRNPHSYRAVLCKRMPTNKTLFGRRTFTPAKT